MESVSFALSDHPSDAQAARRNLLHSNAKETRATPVKDGGIDWDKEPREETKLGLVVGVRGTLELVK